MENTYQLGGFELEIEPLYLLINLDRDIERLKISKNQCEIIGITAVRVEAVQAESLVEKSEFSFRQATEACWASHLKALRYLVEHDSEYAVILEDDFKIEDLDKFRQNLIALNKYDFDLIQLGFLNIGIINKLNKALENFQARILRALLLAAKLGVPFLKGIHKRTRVQLMLQTPKGFVPNSYLPGSHAYVISRRLAECILRDYSTFLLPVDGFYNAISKAGGIRSLRISKSIVGQTMYPTSMRNAKVAE